MSASLFEPGALEVVLVFCPLWAFGVFWWCFLMALLRDEDL
jgi:hypothetical protein